MNILQLLFVFLNNFQKRWAPWGTLLPVKTYIHQNSCQKKRLYILSKIFKNQKLETVFSKWVNILKINSREHHLCPSGNLMWYHLMFSRLHGLKRKSKLQVIPVINRNNKTFLFASCFIVSEQRVWDHGLKRELWIWALQDGKAAED